MIKSIGLIIHHMRKRDYKKFMLMGSMLFCILFNYNVLRTLKDAFIAPTIGVEAISFIDTYLVIPSAVLFAIVYSYLTHIFSFERVFYIVGFFFLTFFVAFTFYLYPNHEALHPSQAAIDALLQQKFTIFSINIEIIHLKWFFKLYSKWIFAIFGVFAELWGSAMIFLLYWQFANSITTTEEAKRLYPISSFIGHIGTFAAGFCIQFFTATKAQEFMVWGINYDSKFLIITLLAVNFSLILTMLLFTYIKKLYVNYDEHVPYYIDTSGGKGKNFWSSFKLVLQSKYLWLISVLVFSYGISINFSETLWKAKGAELYTDTSSFSHFTGGVTMWIGLASMGFMLISYYILKRISWFWGALLTPLTMLITGVIFYTFVLLDSYGIHITDMNLVYASAMLGSMHIIFTKGVKYSFFDFTKEMAFIPADKDLKSKGKAAVDVVGLRLSKAGGSFFQSLIFMVLPATNFKMLAPYFFALSMIMVFFWIRGVYKLNKSYCEMVYQPQD